MDALVLVGLSELDAFADRWGRADQLELGSAILFAVGEHRGPVYVVDDGRPVGTPESSAREQVLGLARRRPAVVWVPPSSSGGWTRMLGPLARRLASDGVRRALVGGLWADADLTRGRVSQTLAALAPLMDARVGRGITGHIPP